MGKTSEWELNYENTIRVIEAIFADGTAMVGTGWPFLEADPARKDVGGKVIGPFHLESNLDAPFYFYVANASESDCWRTTKRGRRFGGTLHDYMLIPGISGYRLTSVYIASGAAVKYAITDNPTSGAPNPVAGGDAYSIGENKDYTFVLKDTEYGKEYRLDLPVDSAKNWAAIKKFILTYEK